ncbi:MAG: nitroreductase family deazaflavin-dependent oxidoreductase [Nitrososphaerota archaeon]|nr:nitroreductase family deazaflavin-dependent oxidoreductase [Nitrososphaerota archaeon]
MWSGGQVIRLETVGRRTGRRHSVLVRYAASDGRVVIFPDPSARQDWVANVLANPAVRLYSDVGNFEGTASLKEATGLDDPVLAVFQRKYGIRRVKETYWGQRRYVEVEVTAKTESGSIEELIYGDLEVAFDSVARSYDRHIFGNPMNRWLRNVSVGLMRRLFSPGDVVLEIGCGTGTETLALASYGVRVVATDISSEMLKVLTGKAERAGLASRVTAVHSRASQAVGRVKEMGPFDGAYSTYGAVNTEPRLRRLLADLHSAIRPGGPLVLGVWNRWCLYEILGYALRMKPGLSVARLKSPVPVGKSRFCVSSYSYSVGEVARVASPHFKLERVLGVEVLLPPSNLTKYLPPEPFLRALKRLDLALGNAAPFNGLGDHFLAVFRNGR